ncbi:MAG: transposase [Pseudohongiella sp.]|uniref:transposase n=1 Tax=Pseudohongiella sp. TaxID=1979412 RepID=UPI00349FF728
MYLCPTGQKLIPVGRWRGNMKEEGYINYGSNACERCPLKAECTRSTKGRILKRYANDDAKDALREIMKHPQVQKAFSKRQAMVEPVFSVMTLKQG